MKTVLSLILVLLMLLSAVGCQTAPVETEPPDTAVTEMVETEPETEPEPPETEPPLDYRTIPCREVEAWRLVGITLVGMNKTVTVNLPVSWSLEKFDNSTYILLCDGNDIGDIRLGEPSRALAVESSSTYFSKDKSVELCAQIRRVREGNGEGFRRLLGFFYTEGSTEHCFYIQVDYEQLDEAAVKHMGASIGRGERSDVPSVSLAGGNDSKKILIAGNSFVRTSAVGTFFTQFVENGDQPYEVEWISTSSVTVVHYLQEEWLSRFRAGEFHAVVMCGLYYEANARDLIWLVNACLASDTTLIMFPAYNEKNQFVSLAQELYPGLNVLHWKNEIQSFIDNGVSKWDLCVDDSYLHSKPLAGYIGAHMLYVTLFGEIPPEYEGKTPLDMETIRQKLGDSYVHTGVSPIESVSLIYELSPN